jgi:DNA sulfur modification protein DndC
MVRELLDVERKHRAKIRRAGLFDSLERAISRSFFEDEEDAIDYALNKRTSLEIESDVEEPSLLEDFIRESEPVAEASE